MVFRKHFSHSQRFNLTSTSLVPSSTSNDFLAIPFNTYAVPDGDNNNYADIMTEISSEDFKIVNNTFSGIYIVPDINYTKPFCLSKEPSTDFINNFSSRNNNSINPKFKSHKGFFHSNSLLVRTQKRYNSNSNFFFHGSNTNNDSSKNNVLNDIQNNVFVNRSSIMRVGRGRGRGLLAGINHANTNNYPAATRGSLSGVSNFLKRNDSNSILKPNQQQEFNNNNLTVNNINKNFMENSKLSSSNTQSITKNIVINDNNIVACKNNNIKSISMNESKHSLLSSPPFSSNSSLPIPLTIIEGLIDEIRLRKLIDWESITRKTPNFDKLYIFRKKEMFIKYIFEAERMYNNVKNNNNSFSTFPSSNNQFPVVICQSFTGSGKSVVIPLIITDLHWRGVLIGLCRLRKIILQTKSSNNFIDSDDNGFDYYSEAFYNNFNHVDKIQEKNKHYTNIKECKEDDITVPPSFIPSYSSVKMSSEHFLSAFEQSSRLRVYVAQPTRLAAKSLASFVSGLLSNNGDFTSFSNPNLLKIQQKQSSTTLGKRIGYATAIDRRFDRVESEIIYATTGYLLHALAASSPFSPLIPSSNTSIDYVKTSETKGNNNLAYPKSWQIHDTALPFTVILDEAHRRDLQYDLFLNWCKKWISQEPLILENFYNNNKIKNTFNPYLKKRRLIIMSASMDTNFYRKYLSDGEDFSKNLIYSSNNDSDFNYQKTNIANNSFSTQETKAEKDGKFTLSSDILTNRKDVETMFSGLSVYTPSSGRTNIITINFDSLFQKNSSKIKNNEKGVNRFNTNVFFVDDLEGCSVKNLIEESNGFCKHSRLADDNIDNNYDVLPRGKAKEVIESENKDICNNNLLSSFDPFLRQTLYQLYLSIKGFRHSETIQNIAKLAFEYVDENKNVLIFVPGYEEILKLLSGIARYAKVSTSKINYTSKEDDIEDVLEVERNQISNADDENCSTNEKKSTTLTDSVISSISMKNNKIGSKIDYGSNNTAFSDYKYSPSMIFLKKRTSKQRAHQVGLKEKEILNSSYISEEDDSLIVVDVIAMHSTLLGEATLQLASSNALAKIIVSTNVAESSITIPNVSLVLDTSVERANYVISGSSAMVSKGVSQSGMVQRRGRTGRTCDGTVIHLITREEFEKRPLYDVPHWLESRDDRSLILQSKLLFVETNTDSNSGLNLALNGNIVKNNVLHSSTALINIKNDRSNILSLTPKDWRSPFISSGTQLKLNLLQALNVPPLYIPFSELCKGLPTPVTTPGRLVSEMYSLQSNGLIRFNEELYHSFYSNRFKLIETNCDNVLNAETKAEKDNLFKKDKEKWAYLDCCQLTFKGRFVASLPIDTSLANFIYNGLICDCLIESLITACAISCNIVFISENIILNAGVAKMEKALRKRLQYASCYDFFELDNNNSSFAKPNADYKVILAKLVPVHSDPWLFWRIMREWYTSTENKFEFAESMLLSIKALKRCDELVAMCCSRLVDLLKSLEDISTSSSLSSLCITSSLIFPRQGALVSLLREMRSVALLSTMMGKTAHYNKSSFNKKNIIYKTFVNNAEDVQAQNILKQCSILTLKMSNNKTTNANTCKGDFVDDNGNKLFFIPNRVVPKEKSENAKTINNVIKNLNSVEDEICRANDEEQTADASMISDLIMTYYHFHLSLRRRLQAAYVISYFNNLITGYLPEYSPVTSNSCADSLFQSQKAQTLISSGALLNKGSGNNSLIDPLSSLLCCNYVLMQGVKYVPLSSPLYNLLDDSHLRSVCGRILSQTKTVEVESIKNVANRKLALMCVNDKKDTQSYINEGGIEEKDKNRDGTIDKNNLELDKKKLDVGNDLYEREKNEVKKDENYNYILVKKPLPYSVNYLNSFQEKILYNIEKNKNSSFEISITNKKNKIDLKDLNFFLPFIKKYFAFFNKSNSCIKRPPFAAWLFNNLVSMQRDGKIRLDISSLYKPLYLDNGNKNDNFGSDEIINQIEENRDIISEINIDSSSEKSERFKTKKKFNSFINKEKDLFFKFSDVIVNSVDIKNINNGSSKLLNVSLAISLGYGDWTPTERLYNQYFSNKEKLRSTFDAISEKKKFDCKNISITNFDKKDTNIKNNKNNNSDNNSNTLFIDSSEGLTFSKGFMNTNLGDDTIDKSRLFSNFFSFYNLESSSTTFDRTDLHPSSLFVRFLYTTVPNRVRWSAFISERLLNNCSTVYINYEKRNEEINLRQEKFLKTIAENEIDVAINDDIIEVDNDIEFDIDEREIVDGKVVMITGDDEFEKCSQITSYDIKPKKGNENDEIIIGQKPSVYFSDTINCDEISEKNENICIFKENTSSLTELRTKEKAISNEPEVICPICYNSKRNKKLKISQKNDHIFSFFHLQNLQKHLLAGIPLSNLYRCSSLTREKRSEGEENIKIFKFKNSNSSINICASNILNVNNQNSINDNHDNKMSIRNSMDKSLLDKEDNNVSVAVRPFKSSLAAFLQYYPLVGHKEFNNYNEISKRKQLKASFQLPPIAFASSIFVRMNGIPSFNLAEVIDVHNSSDKGNYNALLVLQAAIINNAHHPEDQIMILVNSDHTKIYGYMIYSKLCVIFPAGPLRQRNFHQIGDQSNNNDAKAIAHIFNLRTLLSRQQHHYHLSEQGDVGNNGNISFSNVKNQKTNTYSNNSKITDSSNEMFKMFSSEEGLIMRQLSRSIVEGLSLSFTGPPSLIDNKDNTDEEVDTQRHWCALHSDKNKKGCAEKYCTAEILHNKVYFKKNHNIQQRNLFHTSAKSSVGLCDFGLPKELKGCLENNNDKNSNMEKKLSKFNNLLDQLIKNEEKIEEAVGGCILFVLHEALTIGSTSLKLSFFLLRLIHVLNEKGKQLMITLKNEYENKSATNEEINTLKREKKGSNLKKKNILDKISDYNDYKDDIENIDHLLNETKIGHLLLQRYLNIRKRTLGNYERDDCFTNDYFYRFEDGKICNFYNNNNNSYVDDDNANNSNNYLTIETVLMSIGCVFSCPWNVELFLIPILLPTSMPPRNLIHCIKEGIFR